MYTHRIFARSAAGAALALAAALAVVPAGAQEQETGALEPRASADTVAAVGDRIRVTTSDGPERVIGWLDASDRDGLRLVDDRRHEVRTVPLEEIRRLELSRTRRSSSERAAPGAIAGAFAGAALGLALTEEHSCRPENFLCFDFGSEKLYGGLLGAGAGLLVGGLISQAIVPAESWVDARPPSLAVTAVGPSGASVALVVPFPRRRHR